MASGNAPKAMVYMLRRATLLVFLPGMGNVRKRIWAVLKRLCDGNEITMETSYIVSVKSEERDSLVESSFATSMYASISYLVSWEKYGKNIGLHRDPRLRH